MDCKNQASACHCWEHADGLAAYSTNTTAYDQALAHCRPARVVLNVVTRDDILGVEKHCDQTMTCICTTCTHARDARKQQTQPQPWHPRAPRQRAA